MLNAVLVNTLGKRAVVAVQNPAILGDFSEPQPDVAVLKSRDDYYANSHPQVKDVLLVVEVSDSTLRYDREIKMPLYARCGIPEAWLIDVQGNTLAAYSDPHPQQTVLQHEAKIRAGKILQIGKH